MRLRHASIGSYFVLENGNYNAILTVCHSFLPFRLSDGSKNAKAEDGLRRTTPAIRQLSAD